MTRPEVCGDVMVGLVGGRYPARGEEGSWVGERDGVVGQRANQNGVGGVKGYKDVAISSKGERGGGAYSVGQRGDEQKGIMWERLRREDTEEKVWAHTVEVMEGAGGRNAEA